MMAVGAFNQVQSSLRWFVDNFSSIADWRATLLRVASFRRAVVTTDVLHDVETRIEFVDAPPGTFVIDHLEIASPSGCTMLRERDVVIKAGERALIVGQPGTGKTLLFRALAGLWPWGSGRIGRPAAEKVFYMPRSPYLPPGSVREVLAYPARVEDFDTAAYEAALARVGLERLKPDLDTRKRWERLLSTDEQQALAFARLLLHKPDWILIDEVLDAVDEDTHQHGVDILTKDLPRSGIIYIGRERSRDEFYSRTLHLIKDPATRTLVRVKAAAAMASPAVAAKARDVEPTS
jgi:putative ATP-binding cassette transporter